MGKICFPKRPSAVDEVSSRVPFKVDVPQEKLAIRRALRNVNPDSRRLYWCMKKCMESVLSEVECKLERSCSEPSICDCTEDSWDLECFCNLFRSRYAYTQRELQCFIDVIEAILDEELQKRVIIRDCKQCRSPDYCIVPVVVPSSNDEEGSEETLLFCDCQPPICSEQKADEGVCKPRLKPLVFRHFGDILSLDPKLLRPSKQPFKLGCVGISSEIAKWGQFFDLVDRVLRELDRRVSRQPHGCCDGEACFMPRRTDYFENVDRFSNIELFGMPMFYRGLLRWSNCTTKRWNCITNHPHLVIHIPSMSYPYNLRYTAQKKFESLQNIQIGRIGWLVNKNSDVLYVCPSKSNFETIYTLQNFVRLARPDVSLSRLWIIENNDKCMCKHVKEEYRSGCETLFYTPSVYRRVRNLSAGRHGFIISGILGKTDVFIACELRIPIIGPCLNFQGRLLNKHYVMSLLAEANIRHPPFVAVRDFNDLCDKLSLMLVTMSPRCRLPRKWMLKFNCGFYGNQSALICLDRRDCLVSKDELPYYLAKVLPQKLKVNTEAYKNAKDFFVEMERDGGVLTFCPPGDYRTVSLGCFIEHDLAKASLWTAADVVQVSSGGKGGCSWTDLGYIIPQITLPEETIRELVVQIGEILLMELYVGFFGVDLVVFQDEDDEHGVLNYWVVDIDPYYTDLISFDDWRRFCLDIPNSASANPSLLGYDSDPKRVSLSEENHRFVVCSGKLYVDGLSLTSSSFLVDLCKKHKIAYSYKVRAGCMICPIDNEKKALLLFSISRMRETALKHFVRALKALYFASVAETKFTKHAGASKVLDLARDMQKVYGIDD